MLENGLIEEVKYLHSREEEHPTALQAIGYKEIAAALDGRISINEAVSLVKQFSRNYAKKQMTWFTRDERFRWIDAMDKPAADIAEEIIKYMEIHT